MKFVTKQKLLSLLKSSFLLIMLGFVIFALLVAQAVQYCLAGRHEKAVLQALTRESNDPPERDAVPAAADFEKKIMDHGMIGKNVVPQVKLWGVMGDSALLGASAESAQLMKVGDTLQNGEKVVEVQLSSVILEKDGKKRTQKLFDDIPQEPSQRPPKEPPAQQPAAAKEQAQQAAEPKPAPATNGKEKAVNPATASAEVQSANAAAEAEAKPNEAEPAADSKYIKSTDSTTTIPEK